MPVRFEFDPELRLLRSTYTGEFDDQLLRYGTLTVDRIYERLQPRFAITDVSQAKITAHPEVVRGLAHRRPTVSREIPLVLVAPIAFSFGMARMYQMSSADRRPLIHIVRSMEEALSHLGIETVPRFEAIEPE